MNKDLLSIFAFPFRVGADRMDVIFVLFGLLFFLFQERPPGRLVYSKKAPGWSRNPPWGLHGYQTPGSFPRGFFIVLNSRSGPEDLS